MKEGATIGGLLGSLIGLLIKLTIPSGDDVIITGLSAFDITKVATHNFDTYIYSALATLIIAAFVGAIGALVGAFIQLLIENFG
jgi:hypothetical protein